MNNMRIALATMFILMFATQISITNVEAYVAGLSTVNFSVVDRNGMGGASVFVNQEALVQVQFRNDGAYNMKFLSIVTIKDSNDFTVHLAWSETKVRVGETSTSSISWIPEETGVYTIQMFAWESLDNPVPVMLKTPTPLAMNVVESSSAELPKTSNLEGLIDITTKPLETAFVLTIDNKSTKNIGMVTLMIPYLSTDQFIVDVTTPYEWEYQTEDYVEDTGETFNVVLISTLDDNEIIRPNNMKSFKIDLSYAYDDVCKLPVLYILTDASVKSWKEGNAVKVGTLLIDNPNC